MMEAVHVAAIRGGASLVHRFKWWIKLRKLVYEWVQENQTKIIKANANSLSKAANQIIF
jgi:hypothetical protein